jgi:hypothetical protein
MRDFIGHEIKVGSWVAQGGAGNNRAEYGMILFRVDAVGETIKATRLTVAYPAHTQASAVAGTRKATLKKGTKLIVVKPPRKVVNLFERVASGTARKADHRLVGKWLHGQTEDLF